jgi:hemolysin activation/secretion protein
MRSKTNAIAGTVLSCGPAWLKGIGGGGSTRLHLLLGLFIWTGMTTASLAGGQPAALNRPGSPVSTSTNAPTGAATNAAPRFDVQAYVINFNTVVFTNAPTPALSEYTGTNISLERIASAASEVSSEFQKRGYLTANVSIALEQITNGIVTVNVFQGASPQIFISGKPFIRPGETNFVPVISVAGTNGTTNAVVPKFELLGYQVEGNTLLSDDVLDGVLMKYTGTNMELADINKARAALQTEYLAHRYPTVAVTIPRQKLTNGILRMDVVESPLAEILVRGNRWYSSNNVMRALPSLHTNMILNNAILQAELDRANANSHRQIYPVLHEGPYPGTTALYLNVKDQFPVHAKIDLDNQSSPGTPDLRINSSAVYDNLWQLEHSIGVQYSFSPQAYKQNGDWNFYDLPLVANYSGFYRLPLAGPDSIAERTASTPNKFGYDEATRRFNLPPPSGAPELNFYASRSTIDTGVQSSDFQTIPTTNALLSITQHTEQQDVTINQALGFRLSLPVREFADIRSTFSAGFDFKEYDSTTDKSFIFDVIQAIPSGVPGLTNFTHTIFSQPVPTAQQNLRYIPMTVRWDGSRIDGTGSFDFGLSYSPNFAGNLFWHDSTNFANVAGSPHANGYYHILGGSLTRTQNFAGDWSFVTRADGQWASQPLISNEQFGIGGLAGVRGYREGELLGDEGWRITAEQRTPPATIGLVYGANKLVVRGAVYMDYARVYLLDPQGRPDSSALWGFGAGFTASVGPYWEARFLFSVPLIDTPTTEAGQPRFDFALTARF